MLGIDEFYRLRRETGQLRLQWNSRTSQTLGPLGVTERMTATTFRHAGYGLDQARYLLIPVANCEACCEPSMVELAACCNSPAATPTGAGDDFPENIRYSS